MSGPELRVCENGHECLPDARFCSQCGSPLRVELGAINMAPDEPESDRVQTSPHPDSSPTGGQDRGRPRRLVIVAAAVVVAGLALFLVFGVGGKGGGASDQLPTAPSTSTTTTSPTTELTGMVLLPQGDWGMEPGGVYCGGVPAYGFGDIVGGAQVTVEDQTGAIVATGTLNNGLPDFQGSNCLLTVPIDSVPSDLPFYRFQVADQPAVVLSLGQLQADHWIVKITPG